MLELIVVGHAKGVPPPEGHFSYFFVASEAVPLYCFLPNGAESPNRISVQSAAVYSVPGNVLAVETQAGLYLDFEGSHGSNEGRAKRSNHGDRSVLFHRFNDSRGDAIFAPQAVRDDNNDSLRGVGAFCVFKECIGGVQLRERAIGRRRQDLSAWKGQEDLGGANEVVCHRANCLAQRNVAGVRHAQLIWDLNVSLLNDVSRLLFLLLSASDDCRCFIGNLRVIVRHRIGRHLSVCLFLCQDVSSVEGGRCAVNKRFR